MKPLRFQDESNMTTYAFAAAEKEDTHEPLTYQEAVACEDSSKWKVILALTACRDYELEQLDVKMTFLHGNLKESPRQQYKRFDEYILSNGFKRSSYDRCEFDMKEHEEAKKILGIEIIKDRSRKILRVSQFGYISKILNNSRIDNEKSVQMPLGGRFKLSLKYYPFKNCDVERMSKVAYANVVGSLMYLMMCTRPNIAYADFANVGLVYGTDRGYHVDVTSFVDSKNA
nr:hypothetical protein [Tanacetum cinerariifolium]